MKCPYCGKEMIAGVVQSANQIFFTTKPHKVICRPNIHNKNEVVIAPPDWDMSGTCTAFHCAKCKKVVIDYSYLDEKEL